RLSVKPQPTMDEHAAVGRGPGDLEPVPIRIFDHLGSVISVNRTVSEYASHRPDTQLKWPRELAHFAHIGRIAGQYPAHGRQSQRVLVVGLHELKNPPAHGR